VFPLEYLLFRVLGPTSALAIWNTHSEALKLLASMLSKEQLLNTVLSVAWRPRSEDFGGECDQHRYATVWMELFGAHVPFSAVDHTHGAPHFRLNDITVLDPVGLFRPLAKRDPTRGEICAALSHAKAWVLSRRRERPVVVLEDDVYIKKDLPAMLRGWADSGPPGWDMLHVGVNPNHGAPSSPISTECGAKPDCYHDWKQVAAPSAWPSDTQLWIPHMGLHGFLGYLISRPGAAKLLHNLPAAAHVDGWYADFVMNVERPCVQDDSSPAQPPENYRVWPCLCCRCNVAWLA
jgi:hypothetical protein